tara:strand:+ start:225 stop:929 length:705 start_codon:yes stop_codon:yes gene_type:complete
MAKKRLFEQAKIITVFNQKGGCGKTMTTMQLGGLLAWRGYKTLIIDMDEQQTASTWFAMGEARGEPFPANVISVYGDSLLSSLSNMVEDYDFIFIDCPPAVESSIPWTALLASDLGLIPIIPTFDNIWASAKAFELGELAMQHSEKPLQLMYVLGNVRRGRLFEACEYKLSQEDKVKSGLVKKLGNGLSQRNAYQECQGYGTIIHGLKGKPQAAVAELDDLANKLLKIIKVKGA